MSAQRGRREWLDAKACTIVDKWRSRYGREWDADASDVIRIVDALLEEHARVQREAARMPRRVSIGPK